MSGIKFFFILLSLLTILLVFLFSPGKAYHMNDEYSSTADSVLNYSLKEQTGYKWLRELCDIGPRLSGSEQSAEAINWAYEKFKSMGCDTVWLQPVTVPKWIRGEKENAFISKSLKYEGKKLSIASLGGSIGTGKTPLTGRILEIKKFDDIKNIKPEDAEGKIIFYNEPFDESLPRTFSAYGKAVKQRVAGAIEAAKLGGIAAIVRSITSKYDNVPHIGMMRYADSVKQVPAVAIGLEDADLLSSLLLKEPEFEISLDLDCTDLDEVQSYNVIAEIKGSLFPDEVIVVGGHFDSWDKGHGAHDDGAPCIQTMEVLENLIKLNLQPKRTIRCVLFINEENGLRGGLKYGEYSESTIEKHIAAIESDRGAFTPRGFTVAADEKIIETMNIWLPVLNKLKIEWIRKGGGGADISRIKDAVKIGYVPDDQRYFDFHHSDNDVFGTVNAHEMEYGSAAITMLAYLISQEGL